MIKCFYATRWQHLTTNALRVMWPGLNRAKLWFKVKNLSFDFYFIFYCHMSLERTCNAQRIIATHIGVRLHFLAPVNPSQRNDAHAER